ncbi:MAG TPA: sulfatase-like hydrolase/transferase [Bacteroidales bacterium]
MNLTKLLLGMGLLFAAGFHIDIAKAQQKPKIKPNVIVIIADDLGYMDIQCYGADKVKTPNIDRLAKEGTKFNNFYSMPSSSPSCAALLTGCYPKRVGITSDLGPKGADWTEKVYNLGLNPAEMSMAKLVKQNNYATCYIGKWHLGDDTTFLPTKQGFDEFFGIPYANDINKQVNPQWDELPLIDGTKTIERNPDQTLLSKRYTDRAINFITQNSSSQFLLCMALTNTHVPLAVSKDFIGKSKGGLFYDAVAETDWVVGQIEKTIQKLNIDKQTIIIFTSDNGPNILYGNHAGYAGGFREGVNTIFEGGVRVPFIFRYPDRAPGGQETNEFGSIMDIFPTISDLTRNAMPAAKIDGIDLWPVLSGMEKLLRARKAYYYYLGDQLLAVRQGPWKLYLPHSYPSVQIPGKDGKPGKIKTMQTEIALYNLDNDPSETNNVFGENRDQVKKMQALTDPCDKELEQNKRPAGKVNK